MATNTSDAPDDGLVVELLGDARTAAFAQLFTTHFMPVYRYVRRQVALEEEAQDITHQVFSQLWIRGVTLDFTRPLLPLLCTVARFAVIDHLRHQRVTTRFAEQSVQVAALEGPPLALDDPEREFLRRELASFVTRALDGLAPRQREVAVLRWGDQLSYDEIAQRLHISRKTVAIHLARAKAHLRRILPEMYDLD